MANKNITTKTRSEKGCRHTASLMLLLLLLSCTQEVELEAYEIDKETNSLRYFRPVKLTNTCLLCHGDPANSMALWGSSDGMDPTGSRMENWKAGEIHGAFEVIQSLDQADAALTAV